MKYIITAILVLISQNLHSQDISSQIDQYASSYEITGDFSGCILISEEGETVYENCFGKADYSLNVPNQPQTKFKIGSVSKQFTAAAILILEEQGKITTGDTISRFFTNSPIAKKITIENLLTHTSGITDIYNVPNFNKLSCQKKSISDLVNMVFEAGLDFEPGSQYQYSNGGYAVLADIIEKEGGMTYQEFLNEHIFKPLKMHDTGHNKVNEVIPNLSVGYDPLGFTDVKITDYLDPELLKGSGSLYSTIHDLQIWINSIKNQTLLTEESYNKYLNNYGHNYGYGISVYNSFDQPVFGHDGRVNGYIADYLHYKDADISIIILGNIQTGVADFFRRDIAAIVFDKDYKSSAKTVSPRSNVNIDTEKLLGTYAFGPNFKVYVEYKDGLIQARANEGGYSELIPLNDGRFFSRTLYSYIEFVEDNSGKIIKLVWTNNDGNIFEGIKE